MPCPKPPTLALAAALALAGCHGLPATTGMAPAAAPAAGARQATASRALRVQVAFPAGWRLQATEAAVKASATVSLIATGGATVAAGVTDALGAATLTPDAAFDPAVGATFVLEAVKGLGGGAAGKDAVRLRTIVRWTDAGWTSITAGAGGTTTISALTTAIALISALDPLHLPAADAIGLATADGGALAGGPPAGYTAPQVLAQAAMVANWVAGDLDPVATRSGLVPTLGTPTPGAKPGAALVIPGTGFDPRPGGTSVTFGSAPATVLAATATALVVEVPLVAAGPLGLVVTTGAGHANTSYVVGALPIYVSSVLAPDAFPAPGDELTLRGGGFAAAEADNEVRFGAATATPTKVVSAAELRVTVPNGPTDGIEVAKFGGLSNLVPQAFAKALREAFDATTMLDAAATTAEATKLGFGEALWTGGGVVARQTAIDPGDGSDGPMDVGADFSAGGTFDFTELAIPEGTTVKFGADATIRVAGNATIDGVLAALPAAGKDAPDLVLEVGGTLHLGKNGAIRLQAGDSVADGLADAAGAAGQLVVKADAYEVLGGAAITTKAGAIADGGLDTAGAPGTIQVHHAGDLPAATYFPAATSMPFAALVPQVVVSKAFDAGGPATYLLASALGATPDGTSTTLTLADSEDGASWGDWTADPAELKHRFVRFRLVLAAPKSYSATPTVDSLAIKYR